MENTNQLLLGKSDDGAYDGLISAILGLFGSGTNTAIDLVEKLIYDGVMPGEKLMAAAGVSEPEVRGALVLKQMGNVDDVGGNYQPESMADQRTESGNSPVNVALKYKKGWTEQQKAEADAKIKALSEAKTVKTPVSRKGTSASARYKSVYGASSIPFGYDIDHTVDLQLGGSDDISNLNPLEKSVNRSLGKQVQNAIKNIRSKQNLGNSR